MTRAAVPAVLLAAAAFAVWMLAVEGAGDAAAPAPRPAAGAAAAPPARAAATAGDAAPGAGEPESLAVRVVAVHPHDPDAFTQGLLWHEGQVLESTGLYGRSSLRRWDLESGRIVARVDLPAEVFGEGLAAVGERLVQLTWREGRALLWDLRSLERAGELRYRGEGWGLCFDGRHLVMSDGSSQLVFRDPESLAEVRRVPVVLGGEPVEGVNELECVGGAVYANVWNTERVLRIATASGRVTAVIDASGLLSGAERERADVLNGIAFRPEAGTFLLTGKLWPKLFEVQLVPGRL